jgi:type 2 lantibiotic biosynthesis protein LanM
MSRALPPANAKLHRPRSRSQQLPPEWRDLVSRAAGLSERLSGGYRPEPSRAGEAEDLLARWCERIARGDWQQFQKRLAWSDWDLDAVRRCLVPGRLPDPAPIPGWLATLQEICAAGESWRNEGEPIPFEELAAPAVAVARRRLANHLAAEGLQHLLADEAQRDLERSLAVRLSALAEDALGNAFDRHRGGPPHGLAVRLAEAGLRSETHLYRAFIEERSRRSPGGLPIWVRDWPVLARLTAEAVDSWVRNSAEMLGRLRQDAQRIAVSLLGNQDPPLRVLRVEAGLSDPHDGLRTVHALTLDGGRQVIYKPKSLGFERVFGDLLAWCGRRGLSLELRAARVLDRGEYGWAELLAPAPCADVAGARRFHRRAGMLLGLLHALGARDAHRENLIACGEHPALVDLEALLAVPLRKWLPRDGAGEAWYEAATRIEHSVLATGLLPRWQDGQRRGDLRNVGGLGGGQPASSLQLVWRNVNRDEMIRAWREVDVPVQPNVPTLGGEPLAPVAYKAEIAAGFEEIYRLLLRHRDELLASGGLPGGMAGVKARLIFRPTAAYRRLWRRGLREPCLRDGALRSLELDALARVFLEAEARPPLWPLLEAERRALETGDVPRFLVPVDGGRIEAPGGGTVNGALAASCLEALRLRLRGLAEEDLALQLGFIRAALGPEPRLREREAHSVDLTASGLVEVARGIARRIRDHAIAGRDGSVSWIGPAYLADAVYELRALGPHLYSGSMGICLFLAALHRVAGGDEERELSLRGVAPLRRASRLSRPQDGIGGLAGLGSILYGLLWIGELLGEPALLAEAHELSAQLSPEEIARDRHLDVVRGAAGALLALLALDRAIPGPNRHGHTPLELAGLCADHLLARRTTLANGLRSWPVDGGPPRGGFAHGAAGICHALLRLYGRTARPELLAAAREGLESERGLLAPEGPRLATWCNGAPGAALGRLGTLDLLDEPGIREEIQRGLAVTRSVPLNPTDSLCCGTMGRVEVLLQAHRISGDDDSPGAARDLVSRALARAGAGERFETVPAGGHSLFDPTLFRGDAGVGFTLLRLAAPEALPCLLLLEPPRR